MNSIPRRLAVALAASIMLAACGGGDAEPEVSATTAVTTTVVDADVDDLFTEADTSDAPAATTPESEAPAATDVESSAGTDPASDDSAPVGTDVATTDAPPATTGTASRGGSTDPDPTIDPTQPTGTVECRGAAEVRTALIELDDVEFDANSSDAQVAAALQDVSDAFAVVARTTSGSVSADAALLAEGFGFEASGGRFGEDLTPEQQDVLSSDEYFDARDRFDAFASSQCGIDVI
ncbi:MAG: hypothetical protein AB8G26_02395 [Ilumatobacter sp.]